MKESRRAASREKAEVVYAPREVEASPSRLKVGPAVGQTNSRQQRAHSLGNVQAV